MTINDLKRENCCGCTGCQAVCPKNAISMQMDKQGFFYPVIDDTSCVKCGLCYKVCTESYARKNDCIECFAVKNNDFDIVCKSSSGGVSNGLCKKCIDQGGIVYGVAYDNALRVVTTRVDTYAACDKFYGAKYVQTSQEKSFGAVLKDLQDGKLVLFFGTSCHVAGLLSFLNVKKCDTAKLITVDLICHGVPSPLLFANYIDFLGGSQKITNVIFRNKKDQTGKSLLLVPWRHGDINCCIEYKNGKRKVSTLKSEIYRNLFWTDNCLRPQCYQCKYVGEKKASDITIGDFWGIEKAHPEVADHYGVSSVLIHTEHGRNFFFSCEDFSLTPSTFEKISAKNMKRPTAKPSTYDEFWRDYESGGFKLIAKKYGRYNFRGVLRKTFLHKIWCKIRYGK